MTVLTVLYEYIKFFKVDIFIEARNEGGVDSESDSSENELRSEAGESTVDMEQEAPQIESRHKMHERFDFREFFKSKSFSHEKGNLFRMDEEEEAMEKGGEMGKNGGKIEEKELGLSSEAELMESSYLGEDLLAELDDVLYAEVDEESMRAAAALQDPGMILKRLHFGPNTSLGHQNHQLRCSCKAKYHKRGWKCKFFCQKRPKIAQMWSER